MPEFEERQQFRRWWLHALLGVTVLAGWGPLIADGKEVMIGSLRAEELVSAMATHARR